MNEKNTSTIVTYTLDEIEAIETPQKYWDRISSITDEDIDCSDIPEITEKQWAKAKVANYSKRKQIEELKEFCLTHHIKTLSLFGSILRSDFRSDSDVDMIVEFDPDHTPGFIRLASIELELSRLIGRKVDLNTAECLSPYFRDRVLANSEILYE